MILDAVSVNAAWSAIAILQDARGISMAGFVSWFIWRSAYLTRVVSWRNRFYVAVNWATTIVFGRDNSRIGWCCGQKQMTWNFPSKFYLQYKSSPWFHCHTYVDALSTIHVASSALETDALCNDAYCSLISPNFDTQINLYISSFTSI